MTGRSEGLESLSGVARGQWQAWARGPVAVWGGKELMAFQIKEPQQHAPPEFRNSEVQGREAPRAGLSSLHIV